jgi:hypothetical protein
LKSTDWVLGNRKRPIVAPDDDDRRVIGQWTPTAAEREAIEDKNSFAPQVDGNINKSDYDFCDTRRSPWCLRWHQQPAKQPVLWGGNSCC